MLGCYKNPSLVFFLFLLSLVSCIYIASLCKNFNYMIIKNLSVFSPFVLLWFKFEYVVIFSQYIYCKFCHHHQVEYNFKSSNDGHIQDSWQCQKSSNDGHIQDSWPIKTQTYIMGCSQIQQVSSQEVSNA